MDPKALHDAIPERSKVANQQRLGEWDPDVVHDEIPAPKVREFQILHRSDGVRVLTKSVEQDPPGRRP